MDYFGFGTVTRGKRFYPVVKFEGRRYVGRTSYEDEMLAAKDSEEMYDKAAKAAKLALDNNYYKPEQ